MTKTLIFKTTEISSLVNQVKDFNKRHFNKCPHSLLLTYNDNQIYLTTSTLYGPKLHPQGYHPNHDENVPENLALLFGTTPFTIELPLAAHPNLKHHLPLLLSKNLTQTTITLDLNNTPKITFTQLYEDFLAKNQQSITNHAKENTTYNAQGQATEETNDETDSYDALYEKLRKEQGENHE